MSRLTHRNENGEARVWLYSDPKNMARVLDEQSRKEVEVLEKLCHYEDLEEAGRLPSLPCAVGDIIYRINPGAKDSIIPMGVVSIELKGITDTFKEIKCKDCAFGGENFYRFTDIGKTVFLTKAEAEAKLEEMEGK